MPVIQNISVAAGDDVEITFDLDNDTLIDLNGANIEWAVYPLSYGVVSGAALFTKSVAAGSISVPGSPADIFYATLTGADTKALLHNYYHEAFVMDVNGNKNTITVGVFTVTPTKIASSK